MSSHLTPLAGSRRHWVTALAVAATMAIGVGVSAQSANAAPQKVRAQAASATVTSHGRAWSRPMSSTSRVVPMGRTWRSMYPVAADTSATTVISFSRARAARTGSSRVVSHGRTWSR